MKWEPWSVRRRASSLLWQCAAAALRAVTEELARVRMLLAIAPGLSREALTEVTRWMGMSA
jgi:hypothetical protein